MKEITINTQAEYDAVPSDFEGLIVVKGNVRISVVPISAHVEARGSAYVEARESAHVEARGSAHVVARESAHIEARGSAHVEAWGSAHVEARESAYVEAWESAHVEASKWTSVRKMLSHTGTIEGGIVILEPEITTPEDWCAYQGVVVHEGVAILYKAVRDDYRSQHGFLYPVGSTAICDDWDGGREECGGGLHFCPTVAAAITFDDQATRYLACPVALKDMRSPNVGDSYSYKIKASRICGPIVEVDRYGKEIKP